jgi:hypothetical protein
MISDQWEYMIRCDIDLGFVTIDAVGRIACDKMKLR